MQCEWNKITSYFWKARYVTIIINANLYLIYSSDKLVFFKGPHFKFSHDDYWSLCFLQNLEQDSSMSNYPMDSINYNL